LIYTPLHGTGHVFVPRVLHELGFGSAQVVDALGVADPMGATQQFDMPVPRWLKVLLGSTVLLPLLL